MNPNLKACHAVGVEHVGGDMFESVPKGDAIFMKASFLILIAILLSLGAVLRC